VFGLVRYVSPCSENDLEDFVVIDFFLAKQVKVCDLRVFFNALGESVAAAKKTEAVFWIGKVNVALSKNWSPILTCLNHVALFVTIECIDWIIFVNFEDKGWGIVTNIFFLLWRFPFEFSKSTSNIIVCRYYSHRGSFIVTLTVKLIGSKAINWCFVKKIKLAALRYLVSELLLKLDKGHNWRAHNKLLIANLHWCLIFSVVFLNLVNFTLNTCEFFNNFRRILKCFLDHGGLNGLLANRELLLSIQCFIYHISDALKLLLLIFRIFHNIFLTNKSVVIFTGLFGHMTVGTNHSTSFRVNICNPLVAFITLKFI